MCNSKILDNKYVRKICRVINIPIKVNYDYEQVVLYNDDKEICTVVGVNRFTYATIDVKGNLVYTNELPEYTKYAIVDKGIKICRQLPVDRATTITINISGKDADIKLDRIGRALDGYKYTVSSGIYFVEATGIDEITKVKNLKRIFETGS